MNQFEMNGIARQWLLMDVPCDVIAQLCGSDLFGSMLAERLIFRWRKDGVRRTQTLALRPSFAFVIRMPMM